MSELTSIKVGLLLEKKRASKIQYVRCYLKMKKEKLSSQEKEKTTELTFRTGCPLYETKRNQ